MTDEAAEVQSWFPGESTAELEELLETLRSTEALHAGRSWSLARLYRRFDSEALKRQWHHVWLVRISSCFAVLAVLLAIVQLPKADWGDDFYQLLASTEVLSAVLALLAVGFGIWASFSQLWKLRRLQAEQCRFLKFGFLFRSAISRNEGQAFLGKGLQDLLNLETQPGTSGSKSSGKVETRHCSPGKIPNLWIRRELDLIDVPVHARTELKAVWLNQIVEYFLRKRIRFQGEYFKRQAHRRESKERMLKWLPVSLFFLSLLFAIAHFAVPLISKPLFAARDSAVEHTAVGGARNNSGSAAMPGSDLHESRHHTFALVCLLCAAGLPALAAWIRTYRGALEFARNANRFHGMWVQLSRFEKELLNRRKKGDLNGQFEILREAEIAMEAEHRAWIRLMVEAEWFG